MAVSVAMVVEFYDEAARGRRTILLSLHPSAKSGTRRSFGWKGFVYQTIGSFAPRPRASVSEGIPRRRGAEERRGQQACAILVRPGGGEITMELRLDHRQRGLGEGRCGARGSGGGRQTGPGRHGL